ncbi:hypothetical protein [Kribbella albertanoniae]|uniref:hypothetical protein n=1 Tax=Kribbella albertanoniae TaxID=1266829 RepID=UPI0014052A20|nr:hypothetical protein [Kribbella albertanoniae]
MTRLQVNGTRQLDAALRLDGGKHSFAHCLATAALSSTGTLHNVPGHIDAAALRKALELIFEEVGHESGVLRFAAPRSPRRVVLRRELTARSRSLFCLLPALLHHAGEVVIEASPVGCLIGDRPFDWYVDILRRFGATVDDGDRTTTIEWRRRTPADIDFRYPPMTGTVIAVAAAAVAPGRSVLTNCSVEPSCADQIDCARGQGITIAGTLPEVVIEGSEQAPERVGWTISSDRIHAVTYATAALLTRGRVTLRSMDALRIPRFLAVVEEMGAEVSECPGRLTVGYPPGSGPLRAVRIEAGSEPRFSSDWIPFVALLLAARSKGSSEISDDVFPRRLQFLRNLGPLGIPAPPERTTPSGSRSSTTWTVGGVPDLTLRAASLGSCDDIRGSAALALAGLISDGVCTLEQTFHLRRGYTDLARDLRSLGAEAEYVA